MIPKYIYTFKDLLFSGIQCEPPEAVCLDFK